jgi:hypothetical protein
MTTCACTRLPQVPGFAARSASPIESGPLSLMRAMPSPCGGSEKGAPELNDEVLERLDVLELLLEELAPGVQTRTTTAWPPPLAKKSRTEYASGYPSARPPKIRPKSAKMSVRQ